MVRIQLSAARGLAALLALSLSSTAFAQTGPNPRPAPQWLCNAYDVTSGTLQDLVVPAVRDRFQVDVHLGDGVVTVEFNPNDIRKPNFELLVDDGTNLTRIPTPPSVTFQGSATGFPESAAAATVESGLLDAIVRLDQHDGLIWGIASAHAIDPALPTTAYLVYRSSDSNRPGTSCGTDHTHWQPSTGTGVDVRKECEIACDADLEYYNRYGSTTAVNNRITSIVNSMDVIYRRDVDIQYLVTTIIVRTARRYSQTNMGNLLVEFQNWWNGNHGGVQRDVAHLFTGKGSFSGVVGIAYLGVICNLGSAYGVSKATTNTASKVGVVTHEVGHNWNAPHCDGSSPCYVMCSSLGGCNGNLSLFAPVSIGSITAFKNSRGCLSTPQTTPVLTSVSHSFVQVYPPSQITLTGTGFTGANSVTYGIGNTIAPPFVSVTDTRLVFNSPVPPSLGLTAVGVGNAAGTSNYLAVITQPTNPPVYEAPLFSIGGINLPLHTAGHPNDFSVILAAFNDNTTVPAFGFNVLVNNVVLSVGQLSAVGYELTNFGVPAISLTGLQLHTQAILLDQATFQINHITPYRTTSFF